MSEMLANQYFIARNYGEAEKLFEAVIGNDPNNKSSRKKLIICYLLKNIAARHFRQLHRRERGARRN